MDGVRSLTSVSAGSTDASAALPSFNVNDNESPALGVGTSLPKSDQDSLCVGDLTAVLAAVLLASLVCPPQRTRRAWPSAAPARTYQAGWPPPALAPPYLNR